MSLIGTALLAAGCTRTSPRAVTPTTPAPSTTASTAPVSTTLPTTVTPTAKTPSTSAPTTTTQPLAFTWAAAPLDTATRALMTGNSWHSGCPISLDSLRLVRLSYWGFDATAHTGQLVINADSVGAVVAAFRAIYTARFPIRGMRLVDYYGGDDEKSMVADNTSAFNCRLVPGTSVWSQHALGRAVDVNPLENPEVRGSQIDPLAAAPWADRNRLDPAMIRPYGAAWRAFVAAGWKWGGDWTSLKDYMHFSANGL